MFLSAICTSNPVCSLLAYTPITGDKLPLCISYKITTSRQTPFHFCFFGFIQVLTFHRNWHLTQEYNMPGTGDHLTNKQLHFIIWKLAVKTEQALFSMCIINHISGTNVELQGTGIRFFSYVKQAHPFFFH